MSCQDLKPSCVSAVAVIATRHIRNEFAVRTTRRQSILETSLDRGDSLVSKGASQHGYVSGRRNRFCHPLANRRSVSLEIETDQHVILALGNACKQADDFDTSL